MAEPAGTLVLNGATYDVVPHVAPPPAKIILGVNCHIGWAGPYANIAQTINALKYLGVKVIRDSCSDAATIALWKQVASAIGAKFCDYMPEGSPALCQSSLALVPLIAGAGLLAFVEGCNEPDDAYAASQGMTLDWAKTFQQQVWKAGQAAKLPVINLSVGAGWASPDWTGNYPNIGDQSAFCTYANAHTYPQHADPPGSDIARFTGLAKLGATQRPVIHTEFGYPLADVAGGDAVTQAVQGQYVTEAVAAAKANGNAGLFVYGLYDDQAGQWGIFNNDGSPRPAAMALRDAISAAG